MIFDGSRKTVVPPAADPEQAAYRGVMRAIFDALGPTKGAGGRVAARVIEDIRAAAEKGMEA